MQFGTAKLITTPSVPVRLYEYATRITLFEQVKEDILAHVQLHRCGQEQPLFVYGDLLWWGSDFVTQTRGKISAVCRIAQEQTFFVASYSRSGPPTCDLFTSSLETYSPTYARSLQERVLAVVALVQKDMEPVQVYRHDGSAAFNVFHRILEDGVIQMEPNYQVPTDHTLTILVLRRADGSLKGAMIRYSCHAGTFNENTVQPNYSGAALRMLDDAFPGSVSIFLQGCTAGLRPNSVLGRRSVFVGYDKVLISAEDFANACRDPPNLKAEMIIPRFNVQKQLLELPLEGALPAWELEERAKTTQGVQPEWTQTVLKKSNRPGEQLELSRTEYGDRLRSYTFNAEVSQYYATHAREVDPYAVCVVYTNGMIGYLSTVQQIEQGSYEPVEPALYFALVGTHLSKTEAIIHVVAASAAQSE